MRDGLVKNEYRPSIVSWGKDTEMNEYMSEEMKAAANDYTAKLAKLGEMQNALKVEQAKPEAIELNSAQSALAEAEGLGAIMQKMPGGPALHTSLITAAKEAVVKATEKMPAEYTLAAARVEQATQEADGALYTLTSAIMADRDGEPLQLYVEAGIKAIHGSVSRPRSGSSTIPADLPHSITVAGKLFSPEITQTGRQSWPGLKTAMIAAGVPPDSWTKNGNTTNVRVAAAHPGICTLHH